MLATNQRSTQQCCRPASPATCHRWAYKAMLPLSLHLAPCFTPTSRPKTFIGQLLIGFVIDNVLHIRLTLWGSSVSREASRILVGLKRAMGPLSHHQSPSPEKKSKIVQITCFATFGSHFSLFGETSSSSSRKDFTLKLRLWHFNSGW